MAVWLALLLVLLPYTAGATSTPETQLKQVETQLENSQKKQKELKQNLSALDRELDGLQKRLVEATALSEKSADELDELKEGLADLEGTALRRGKELQGQRAELASTLATLQRFARMPPEVMLLRQDDPVVLVRTGLQLRQLLPALQERTERLSATLRDLKALRRQLESRKAEVEKQRRKLRTQQTSLSGLMSERQRLLEQSQRQQTAEQRKAAQLAERADDLRALLKKLEAMDAQREKKTPSAAAVLTPVALPAAALKRLPARGKSLVKFGQTDRFGEVSRGMTLATRPGSAVVAVAPGTVAFAGPFRGYGRLLILEHAGNYHTVNAGLETLSVAVGQRVAAGEPLGTMGESGDHAGELYFEVRHGGDPVDPLGNAANGLTAASN